MKFKHHARQRAIILHGTCYENEYRSPEFPSLSNSHWLPWLQKQLLIEGWEAHTPEVYEAYKPTYEKWLIELERYLPLNEQMILVGYSCGAGFLVRYLSENPEIRVGKVILVAPWLDPAREQTTDMFDFDIDPELSSRANEIHLLVSSDDDSDVQQSTKQILESVRDVQHHQYDGKGHFSYHDLQTDAFPELLTIITGEKS